MQRDTINFRANMEEQLKLDDIGRKLGIKRSEVIRRLINAADVKLSDSPAGAIEIEISLAGLLNSTGRVRMHKSREE